MINQLFKLRNKWKDFERNLQNTNGTKKINHLTLWISKSILRSAFELIMDKDKSYTRDLYYCYQRFVKYYPNQDQPLYKVLELAIKLISNKKEILQILEPMYEFLLNQLV